MLRKYPALDPPPQKKKYQFITTRFFKKDEDEGLFIYYLLIFFQDGRLVFQIKQATFSVWNTANLFYIYLLHKDRVDRVGLSDYCTKKISWYLVGIHYCCFIKQTVTRVREHLTLDSGKSS